MFATIKRNWLRLKLTPPGQRFQQQYKRRRNAAPGPVQKALLFGGGVLLTGVGIILFFLPGPGVVFVLLGALLIAQQSLRVARALDWSEMRVRKLLLRTLVAWRRFSAPSKILLVGSAAVLAALIGFSAFKFLTA